MKILFISHTYPPIKGGVEIQNYELFTALSKTQDCKLLANRNRKLIPLFLPYATLRAILTMHKYDVLLLGSGLLGITGWFVKKLTRKPVVIVTHGLDLTYAKSWYQKLWVKIFIPSADKLIAVGNETVRAGVERTIPEEKFVFIPNGIDTEKYFAPHSREELTKILKTDIADKYVLLTSGRLARRKGVAWFIRNVLPKLDEKIVYAVAGDGPDRQNVLNAIKETGLEKRVFVLGRVSDEVRDTLFNTCDLFIQPNIKIKGDMEGFGISVIEAVSCQLPVIVSDLEGLKDAIKDGENGFLVEPENPEAYVSKINSLLIDETYRKEFGQKARQYVLNNYQWESIAKKYVNEIRSVVKNKKLNF